MNTETVTEPKPGLDWIGLVATPTLGIIACFALYYGYDVVSGTATGAIAGYYTRLYK